jgi:hypothetical protein
VATAHKVAGMFGRRDPMRRYMDKIMAMIEEIGAPACTETSQHFCTNSEPC